MQFTDADLDTIFDAVGVAGVLACVPGGATPIQVKFRRTSLNESGMLTDRPTAMMKSSSIVGVDLKTATLAVMGETYRMTKPFPDDTGMTTVQLIRA